MPLTSGTHNALKKIFLLHAELGTNKIVLFLVNMLNGRFFLDLFMDRITARKFFEERYISGMIALVCAHQPVMSSYFLFLVCIWKHCSASSFGAQKFEEIKTKILKDAYKVEHELSFTPKYEGDIIITQQLL